MPFPLPPPRMCARREWVIRIGALSGLAATSARVSAAPAVAAPVSAAASPGAGPVDSPRGEDTGTASNWSIQAALQVAFPPLPLVVGFCDGSRRWPVTNPFARVNSRHLVVPHQPSPNALASDTLASTEPTGGATTRLQLTLKHEVEGADARQQSGEWRPPLILRDVATLPWSAGCKVTATLASVSCVRRCDDDVSCTERHAAPPAHTFVSAAPPLPPPRLLGSAGEHHGCESRCHADTAPWRASCEYPGPQPCAEASAVALHSFAIVQQRQQRRPLLVFVAERACRSGDLDSSVQHDNLDADDDETDVSAAAAMRGCLSDLPSWLPPTTPVRTLPVEVYAERTPLHRVGGTAALQLRFCRLQRQREVAEPSAHPSAVNAAGRWTLPAGAQLIWTGRCWAAETDAQLVEFEESLLEALAPSPVASSNVEPPQPRQHPRRLSPVRELAGAQQQQQQQRQPLRSSVATALPRLWLPGSWSASTSSAHMKKLSLEQLSDGDAAGTDGWAAARTSAALVKAPGSRTCPASVGRRCRQWVVRLRKLWIVCGVKDGALLHGSGGPAHPHGRHESGSAPSATPAWRTRRLHPAGRRERAPVVEEMTLRYPNYNLLSGAPLDLGGLHCPPLFDWRRDRCPRWRPPGVATAAAATLGTSMDGQPHRSHHNLASMEPPAGKPLLCAVLSRQVAWVPLTACSEGGGSACALATTWQLPDALRVCYAMPSGGAPVPHPELCTPAAATAGASDGCATPWTTFSPPPSPAPPPPPPACLAVPHQEWWTGFFLHDAPAWWRREVPAPCAATSDADPRPSDPQTSIARRELQALLEALCAEGGVPPLPADAGDVRAAVDWLGAPAPSTDPGAPSARPPRVCLLHLVPAAPTARGASTGGTLGARDACLQWTVVPATASVTVNHFFSLEDVVRVSAAGSESAPRAPPVIVFVEVKAALQILLRWQQSRTTAPSHLEGARDWRGKADAVASTRPWWERLSDFHAVHSFTMDGAGNFAAAEHVAADAAAQEPVATRNAGNHHSSAASPAADEDVEEEDLSAEKHDDVVSALGHPSVKELVCACVSLLLQTAPAPKASWSRTTYHALLERALASTQPHVASSPESARAASSITDDAGAAPCSACVCARVAPAAPEAAGEAASSAGGGAALPHGAAVRRYDEDGTRCADAAEAVAAKDGGGGSGTGSDDELHDDRLRTSRGDVPGVSHPPQRRCSALHAAHRLRKGLPPWRHHTGGLLAFAGSSLGAEADDEDAATATTAMAPCTVLDPTVAEAIAAACEDRRRGVVRDELKRHGRGDSEGTKRTNDDGDDGDDAGASAQRCATASRRRGLRRGVRLDSTLLHVCQPPRWASAAAAAVGHRPDVLERLVTEERHRFVRGWSRLLKYLPCHTNDTATQGGWGASSPSPSSSPQPAMEWEEVRLLQLFPFLQPSATQAHCVEGSDACRDTPSAPFAPRAAPPLPAETDDVAVVVPDLGICVLHVRRTDVYVNAANLLYRE